MRKILFITITFCLIVGSCANKNKEREHNQVISDKGKVDSAFNFTIKTAVTFIDTKSRTYTVYYRYGKTKTIHFEFSKDELEKIKSLYFGAKLDTLPDNYNPNCFTEIVPTFDEEYRFFFNTISKGFIYNKDFQCNSKIVQDMRKLEEYIFKIVYSNKEVLGLEASDFIFM